MARTKATQKKRMKQLRKLYPDVAEQLLEDKARQESVEAGRRLQEQERAERELKASRQQERKYDLFNNPKRSTRLDNENLLKQVMSAKGKVKGPTADKVHINRRRYAVYDTESEDEPEIEEVVVMSERGKRHQ
ncbi:hypothetical protein CYLTODRAFT_442829, partial [Cylindrobasidium torrendii FP15055 ss-10]